MGILLRKRNVIKSIPWADTQKFELVVAADKHTEYMEKSCENWHWFVATFSITKRLSVHGNTERKPSMLSRINLIFFISQEKTVKRNGNAKIRTV
jgi:hypothetical protein